MKVRSVTLGNNLSWPLSAGELDKAGRFLARARTLFGEAGLEVQTTRLATQPLRSSSLPPLELARALEAACRERSIDYCSLGPCAPDAGLVASLIASTEITFASIVTAEDGEIVFDGVRAAASVVWRVADSTPLGFGNLRFAAIAHCGPNIPFFPASYHDGGHPKFSLALEAADVIVSAFASASSPGDARARLADALVGCDQQIAPIAKQLEREFGIEDLGVDFSPAPFPTAEASIGTAFERLGIERFGGAGSLFISALITSVLKTAPLARWGFNGLMLSVLEDASLADGTDHGDFAVNELLLHSAVCGTGLDAVPLPGDVTEDELAGIILDMSALSVALNGKSLTARLLPVPGKKAGERTEFEFPYFANGTVLPVKGLSSVQLWERLLGS